MRNAFTVLALSATILLGQGTVSSHSGWNFEDTLQTARTVVVADIIDGGAVDAGALITVRARLRVVRTLTGNMVMGEEIPVAWKYTPAPSDTPATLAKMPHARAIFFLGSEGQALQAMQMGGAFGGYFVTVPATPLPGDLFYAADAKLAAKLASEFAWAIEDLVTRRASDFGPQKLDRINPAAPPEFVQTRMQFHGLREALANLDKGASDTAMRHLSASPDVNLRLLGILGRIRNSDVTAVAELERDLPRLVKAFDANMATRYMMDFDWDGHAEASMAFGRMALAEVTLQGLDSIFVMRVSPKSRWEVMPCLAAMMHSPDPFVSDRSMGAMCQIVRSSGKYWKAEMEEQCATQAPIPDRQKAKLMLQFWTDWWAQTSETLSQSMTLPRVSVPARYSRQVPEIESMPILREGHFQGLLSMMRTSATHAHGANGEILEHAKEPLRDPVSARLSDSDREVFHASVAQTLGRLDGVEEKLKALMNAARQQGTFPAREQMAAINEERQKELRDGLTFLEQKLSREGWAELDAFLKQMGGSSMRAVTAH